MSNDLMAIEPSTVTSPKGIYKLLYEKSVNFCSDKEENKQSGKNIFVTNLHNYLNELIDAKAYSEIFKCFETAQELYGDDPDILNVLGVVLNKLEKPNEAINYLNKAVTLSPDRVKIQENLENVINQWVPRWHFSMLNDKTRNNCYKQAIENKISEGYENVLDIGTGTGLLALYCHEAGAKNIYACETNEIMCRIAEEVFKENETSITLISDHSTNISKDDLPEEIRDNNGFDLIVTEIFDCGAFGEGVLSTLIHAKENLLSPEGMILPTEVTLFVNGVNRVYINEKYQSLRNSLGDSIYLKNAILISNLEEPYEPMEPISNHMYLVTDQALGMSVDFNSIESLKDALEGKLDVRIKLVSLYEGYLEGFLVYFELNLDKDNVIKNYEPYRDKMVHCWDPVIFPLNRPMQLKRFQTLHLKLSCKDGILKLEHDYNKTQMQNIKINPNAFAFLMDDYYICELEYNIGQLINKNFKKLKNVGDFCPFPHVGYNLLKEKIVEKLYCLEEIRECIEIIADWNCISKNSIVFIDNFDNFFSSLSPSGSEEDNIKFDLIILHPFTNYGTLNESQLKYYEKLKSKHLTAKGSICPYKLNINCRLIYSRWLQRVSYIRDDELTRYGIEKRMNYYSTKHQFDYPSLDTWILSDPTSLATIKFNDNLNITDKNVKISEPYAIKCNGILYFYDIQFTDAPTSIQIYTNRKNSFCKSNCFVEDALLRRKEYVTVRFKQSEFSFRCEVINDKNDC